MKADFKTRIGIFESLQQVCRKEGDFAVYAKGESDNTVAKRLGVTESQVASVRRAMFGNVLRREPGIAERLADIEQRLTHLEKSLGVTGMR